MAGVPTGRACEACRRQRKKCDERQPACGRCSRLKLQCVGSGARRFLFKSENKRTGASGRRTLSPVPAPRHHPSNQITRLAGQLAFILESKDVRFSLNNYGLVFGDLPRRLGSCLTLDASAAALVASFHALHDKQPGRRAEALNRHIGTLEMLRKSLGDLAKVSLSDTVCAIYIMVICQEWVGNKEASRISHGEMLTHLIRNATMAGQLDKFDFGIMQAIYGIVVEENFINPNTDIGPWFWRALDYFVGLSPILPSASSSIHPRTIAEVSVIIRDPVRYFSRIRIIYDNMRSEAPLLREQAAKAMAAYNKPGASFETKQMSIVQQKKYSILLGISTILNRILSSFEPDPDLIVEAQVLCSETLLLARQTLQFRPLAASHMPQILVAVLAIAAEPEAALEAEELMMEYEGDFYGVDYMRNVRLTSEGFERIDQIARSIYMCPENAAEMGLEDSSIEIEEAEVGCIIL